MGPTFSGPPIYTTHSRERMEERHVSDAEVRAVIADPDTTWTDGAGNPVLRKEVLGRKIKVVIAKGGNHAVVITVAD